MWVSTPDFVSSQKPSDSCYPDKSKDRSGNAAFSSEPVDSSLMDEKRTVISLCHNSARGLLTQLKGQSSFVRQVFRLGKMLSYRSYYVTSIWNNKQYTVLGNDTSPEVYVTMEAMRNPKSTPGHRWSANVPIMPPAGGREQKVLNKDYS